MVVQEDVEPTEQKASSDKKHKLRQRFQVVRKLGQGTYGKVQLAINRTTDQEVAIKTIKKSKIETEQDSLRIRREIQIMSSIQHPYIIHIYEVFENKDKIVLVMQYASGGELYDYVSERKELSSDEARRIFRQVASAVYYCHKNKICHRDLKLENILLDEKGNAKIADFGLSNVYDERHFLSTFCGSPLYASPEIVKGTPYYGPEVDCWSLGVLLYTLVYGAMPFDGSNFKRLVRQISEADYYEPKRKSDASPLIRRLLTVDPAKRATVVDICQDRWVNQGFDHSLLQLAEDMSNLTPVRLDLLLALAPVSPTPEEPSDPQAQKSDSFDYTPGKVDDSADFIPAALAAELEGQGAKREGSFDGLVKMSSVSHKNKKVRTSDSGHQSSVGTQGGPFNHDEDFAEDEDASPVVTEVAPEKAEMQGIVAAPSGSSDAAAAPKSVPEAAESEDLVKPTTPTPDQSLPAEKEPAKATEVTKPEASDVVEANKTSPTSEENQAEQAPQAAVLARRGSGIRCPGKIVIPKCLSSQGSPTINSSSPKFKDTKKPPLPQSKSTAEPPKTPEAIQSGARSPATSEKRPEKTEAKRTEQDVSVPQKDKSKSPLDATRPEETVKVVRRVRPPQKHEVPDGMEKSPSTEKTREVEAPGILRRSTSKLGKPPQDAREPDEEPVENVLQSTAEIVLTKKERQEEPAWKPPAEGPEEEAPEEAPPRRPSPEGSADEPARPATDSPVRSYKKFTFGKDGTCITESGRVYAQPKSDGSWTTVEKKTKITRRPSSVASGDEEPPPVQEKLTVPRSESGSSSESNDIFSDMFSDWRTSGPFGNLMRMKSSVKKLNNGSLFRSDPFTADPFKERRAREWGRRGGASVSNSTERDSSDEDDFDLHFDNSHPQALFQFMRNMSRDFRNHWKSFLPSSPFARAAKESSSRSPRETLLRFVVDRPPKPSGSEPGTPHTRAGGDPFSKRMSGVWDPVDRASLFGTLRHKNRLHEMAPRHDRGASLDRSSDFWGAHQDPEGTRHRVEKWLHLSDDAAPRPDDAPLRSQPKYNRSKSDKFNLAEDGRPTYRSEISVDSTAPTGAQCGRSLSVHERGTRPRPLVRMQVSINNRSSNPNAHIVITTPPSSARTECGLWPRDESARTDDEPNDSSLLEALQTRGIRGLISHRNEARARAREASPRSEPPDPEQQPPPPQSDRGKQAPSAGPAEDACCMDTNKDLPSSGRAYLPPPRPKTIPISDERRRLSTPASPSGSEPRSPGEESVQERIHRKSFYQRFHEDPRAAARRRSALWDTEYSGLWSQDRDLDGGAFLRKSRSLWDNHVREPRSRSAARVLPSSLALGPQNRHGLLWGLGVDAGVPEGAPGVRTANRRSSSDYDSLENEGPSS
ncbi:unnamed protein product [Ixodes pacificus]